jgi:hypothetical protein
VDARPALPRLSSDSRSTTRGDELIYHVRYAAFNDGDIVDLGTASRHESFEDAVAAFVKFDSRLKKIACEDEDGTLYELDDDEEERLERIVQKLGYEIDEVTG